MPAEPASYALAHIPGDGVGPEVTEVARNCVDAAAARHGFGVTWRPYSLGARHYLDTGEVLPDSALAELRTADAILLGAVGSPEVPPGVLERGLLLRLRAELDLYVNLRPSKLREGVARAVPSVALQDLDLVIVRENTEGLYAGAGGTVHAGTELRDGHRGVAEHLGRGEPVRAVRGGARGQPQRAAHPGAQDQRADPRRPALAAGRRVGRRAARRPAQLRPRGRGLPVPGGRARRGST